MALCAHREGCGWEKRRDANQRHGHGEISVVLQQQQQQQKRQRRSSVNSSRSNEIRLIASAAVDADMETVKEQLRQKPNEKVKRQKWKRRRQTE